MVFKDEAKKKFLAFATSFDALWFEIFSDLVGASMRMDALTSQERKKTGYLGRNIKAE